MDNAYAVDGFHYCQKCFEMLFDNNEDWPVDVITPTDFEPTFFVKCEECGNDVFGRETETIINIAHQEARFNFSTIGMD